MTDRNSNIEEAQIVSETPKAQEKELSLLVPGATYKWDPETEFSVSGEDFTTFFQNLNNIVSSHSFQVKVEEAQQTMKITKLFEIAQKMLQRSVSEGGSRLIDLPKGMNTPSDAIMDSHKNKN